MILSDIPIELIQEIERYLDRPSLLSCLQVSRQLNAALSPLVWVHITKQQWCHPYFPIKKSTYLSKPFFSKEEEQIAERVLRLLKHTRMFEWSDYLRPRPQGQGQGSAYILNTSLASRPTAMKLIQTPFPLTHTSILQHMPNLTHFTLLYSHQGPSSQTILRSILNPLYLQRLRVLVLRLPENCIELMNEGELDILFSQLEELELREGCVEHQNGAFDGSLLQYQQAAGGGGGQEQLQQQQQPPSMQPWRLKKLIIQDRAIASLLRYCHNLEHFTVTCRTGMWSGYRVKLTPRQRLCLWTRLKEFPHLREINVDKATYMKVDDEADEGLDNGIERAYWRRMANETDKKGGVVHPKCTLYTAVDTLFW